MKCVICGGDVVEKKVREEVIVGNDVFFVDIVTEVCTSCGERYYSDTMMDKLAKLKERLSKPPVKDVISLGHVYRVPQSIYSQL